MTGVTQHLMGDLSRRVAASAPGLPTPPGPGKGSQILSGTGGFGARSLGKVHFSELLNPRDAATGRVRMDGEREAYEAAKRLVSITLVEPVLKMVREDPLRSELFHGGAVEEAFGPQLDSILAERVTGASGFSIVERVYERVFSKGKGVDTHG